MTDQLEQVLQPESRSPMYLRAAGLARLAAAGVVAALLLTAFAPTTSSVGGEARGRALGATLKGDQLLDDCGSRELCQSPLIGGLRLTFTGWACTSGFVARDPALLRTYVLTAGHCLADSGLGARWSHGRTKVGRAALHAFRDGSSADVGAIEVDAGEVSHHVFGSTSRDPITVVDRSPNSSQVIGSPACRSGATSGWECGQIVAADVDVRIRGQLVRHTWWTDFPSNAGDSGAPIVDPAGRALGVLIATTSTQSVFSTVDWIEAELGVRICLSERCD